VHKMAGVLCWKETRGSAIVSFYRQQATLGYLTMQDDLSRGDSNNLARQSRSRVTRNDAESNYNDEATYGKRRMCSERSMMTQECK